jgi:glycine hydroxymethyltransferase
LILNWERLGKIADGIGAWFVADISHVSGLVLGGTYPSPVSFAHVVTTTTHKTLRGPRGAMIMVTKKGIEKDTEIAAKIDKAVFPGLQGGPHNNTTAGIAQALIEADSSEFRAYGKQVVANAKYLAEELINGGLTLVTDGTECHLMVIDLRPLSLSGNVVVESLEMAGIIVNRNSVPNDPSPPYYPSGIRIGTPALTTRGMKGPEMKIISEWILKVINHVNDEKLPEEKEKKAEYIKSFRQKIKSDKFLKNIAEEVKNLCKNFPTP